MLTDTAKRDRSLYMRVRNLPDQLERARHRVRQLENEARRYGMTELLEVSSCG